MPTSSATATYTTLPLSEPWTLHFDTAYGGPLEPVVLDKLSSWSVNTDPAIRYYSGTVSYTTNLNLSALPPQGPCWLYLGRVADVAEVFVNGQSCGTAWTAPFRVDVSAALKPGVNDILIKVSNTWANRLEGDALLPEADRLTWTDGRYRKKTRDLLEAGLLGPASLEIPVTVKKSTQ
ncbi:MAG: Glycosyl hydrolases family 2, sugar binding domain [Bacteroidetes bacterium ADurb.Bin416]|nr:MAG: Glycosyl hydrolases family 2, sugar binding domain [Bacteroidetes bacterium ADurb.Bin416]